MSSTLKQTLKYHKKMNSFIKSSKTPPESPYLQKERTIGDTNKPKSLRIKKISQTHLRVLKILQKPFQLSFYFL